MLTGHPRPVRARQVVMAATDSYRLAVKETPVDRRAARARGDHPGPGAAGARADRAGSDDLQLGMHDNHVVFGADGTWLTTRRIDGQFPNVRQLLPEQFEHELRCPGTRYSRSSAASSLMAQRNSPLRLRFADGELTVSASHRMSARLASRCRRRTPATRWRSASTRSSCATGSSRSTRAAQVRADQPASAGGAGRRARRLPVSGHADQAAG